MPPPPPSPPPPLPEPLKTYTSQTTTPHSLTLITSILTASSTWLMHAFVSSHCSRRRNVLLVSLSQDRSFHADGLRKLGVDLGRLERAGKLAFLGMEDVYLSPPTPPTKGGICAADVKGLSSAVQKMLRTVGEGGDEGTLVVLDGLDILLGTGGSAVEVVDLVLGVLEVAEHTVVSVNADEALMRGEEEHAGFVVGLGHIADRVFGLRVLDTGVARDVSGVMRVTGGKDGGKELLYFVGDGGVEVFERGQVRDG